MLSLNNTTLIIIFTVIISMMAWQNNTLFDKLIFQPQRVAKGEVHRMLTHGLIHADGWHLLINMFVLLSFGQYTDKIFFSNYVGGYGLFVFYFLAIIAAIIPTYMAHKNHTNYRSLGASGGVAAVLFASVLMNPWSTIVLFFIIPMPAIVFAILYVAYEVYADKRGGTNVNHSAHLWGAGFGVIATIAIEPKLIPYFLNALMTPSF